ncbi:MAG: hypothetical protein ABRQ37_28460, partial [Candidatus Eremiobacterota bacterium]
APVPKKEIKKQTNSLIIIFLAFGLLFALASAGVIFFMMKPESPEKLYAKTLASVKEKKDLPIAFSNMDKLIQKKVKLSPGNSKDLTLAWIDWANALLKEKNPDLNDVKKMLEEAGKINKTETKELVETYMVLLDKHMAKEDPDFKQEEEILAVVEEFKPDDFGEKRGEKLGRYHRILGQKYLKSDPPDLVKGKSHLKTAETLDKDNPDTLLALASYYMDQKDYDNVIQYAKTLDKNNPDISIMLADSYCLRKNNKNMSEALKYYDLTLKESKGDESKDYKKRLVDGYNSIGSYYLNRKNNKDAIKIFSKTRNIDKNNKDAIKGLVKAHVAIGLDLYGKGLASYDNAAYHFKEVKKLDKKNETANKYLAKIEKEKEVARNPVYTPPAVYPEPWPENPSEPVQYNTGGDPVGSW